MRTGGLESAPRNPEPHNVRRGERWRRVVVGGGEGLDAPRYAANERPPSRSYDVLGGWNQLAVRRQRSVSESWTSRETSRSLALGLFWGSGERGASAAGPPVSPCRRTPVGQSGQWDAAQAALSGTVSQSSSEAIRAQQQQTARRRCHLPAPRYHAMSSRSRARLCSKRMRLSPRAVTHLLSRICRHPRGRRRILQPTVQTPQAGYSLGY